MAIQPDPTPVFPIDPNAKTIYTWDWTKWCTKHGTTVDSYVFVIPGAGVTIHNHSQTGHLITAMISATAVVDVVCRITAVNGEFEDQTFKFVPTSK